MSCAAPLSSEQARMALPILVLPMKSVSATMMTTQHGDRHERDIRDTQLAAEEGNTRLAARRLEEVREHDFGLEPQSSSAAFWRK